MAEKRRRMPRAAAVGDLLATIFRGKPVEKRLKEGKIWLVWNDCVGEQIAGHAGPAAFRDGILTLSVDSAPWMQQLTYLKKEIIAKLNKKLGEELVTEIYLRAGRREKPAAPRPAKRAARDLSPEEEQRIAERAAAIADPELRVVFADLLTRHLAMTAERDA